MHNFCLGVVAMGFVTASMFFLRFWRETRDSLFLLFATAFALESANRAALALLAGVAAGEAQPMVYGLRVVSYSLIVAGVATKNLPRRPG